MKALTVYDCSQLLDIFFNFGSWWDSYCRESAVQLPPENRDVLIEIGSPMRNMCTSNP